MFSPVSKYFLASVYRKLCCLSAPASPPRVPFFFYSPAALQTWSWSLFPVHVSRSTPGRPTRGGFLGPLVSALHIMNGTQKRLFGGVPNCRGNLFLCRQKLRSTKRSYCNTKLLGKLHRRARSCLGICVFCL